MFVPSHFFLAAVDFILDIGGPKYTLWSTKFCPWFKPTNGGVKHSHMIRHKDILPPVVQDIQWNSTFLAVRDPILPYVLQSEAAYEMTNFNQAELC